MSFDPAAFNPHAPAFLADPYPTYAQFRQFAPVAKVAPYNSYWVFRHDDVARVLGDAATFVKRRAQAAAPAAPASALAAIAPGVFSMDPPRHTLVRGILDELWSTAIAGADALAQAEASRLLQALPDGRRIEVMANYALPLPAAVLMKILGIPAEDVPLVQNWVGANFAGHDVTAPAALQGAALSCGLALGAYFQALMSLCPASPGMVASMAESATQRGMTPYEAQQSAVNLAVAGYLSTTFLIGSGILNLLETDGAWDTLRDEPGLMPFAVEEMLRFDAPAQLIDRYAATDVTLSGVDIPAGATVTAVTGSANRDPDAIANPDRFDLARTPVTNFAFGAGPHYCLGAALARTVTPVALSNFMQHFPKPQLAGLVQWQSDPYMRAPSNLPLSVQ